MLPFEDMGERDLSFLLLVFHLSDTGGSLLLCGLAGASNAAGPAIAPPALPRVCQRVLSHAVLHPCLRMESFRGDCIVATSFPGQFLLPAVRGKLAQSLASWEASWPDVGCLFPKRSSPGCTELWGRPGAMQVIVLPGSAVLPPWCEPNWP